MTTQGQKPYPQKALFLPRLTLALALFLVGSMLAFNLYLEHVQIEKRERDRLATQAKIIDENLSYQLEGVYLALEAIRNELPLWKQKSNREAANRHLLSLADAMPGIRTFMITDPTGTVTTCNRHQVIGQNISYREYFQAPLQGRNLSTLYISAPFTTILGNFVINVSLIIPGPRGEFAGIVSAALDPEYFTVLLGSVLYAPDMWSAMTHSDGKQFLMVPERNGMAGLNLAKPGTFFTRHMESGLTSNVFSGITYATGEERLLAIRSIRPAQVPMDKHLVVAVGRAIPAVYADWRREAIGKGILFAALILATSLALYFIQRRQRKHDAISARYLEELIQAKEDALQANQAKSRFLTTVAHEFRTPLSLLISSTDILDRYGDRLGTTEYRQQHDHIRNAARQMSSLVDSVLSFNRTEGQPTASDTGVIDTGFFCRTLAEEVQTACGNGQGFTVSIAADCGALRLNTPSFRRVVENLLSNAFRYTAADGSISLHVERHADRLLVVVTDSGIGIPEECRPRIFEAFYRCANVNTQRGLGLGLSIVQEALTHLGGTITVDSTVGKGTTMRVQIPVIDPTDTEEQQSCTQS